MPARLVGRHGGPAGPTLFGRRRAPTPRILVLFALFWCGLTGVFLSVIGGGIVMQLDAGRRFLPVEAVVVSSQTESRRSSKGTTYQPKITYRYEVDGKEYSSDRYAFGMPFTSDSRHSRKLVADHPAGKRITAYYDPADPARAVLTQEVPAGHLFLLLFLQPFLCVALGLMVGAPYVLRASRGVRQFLSEPVSPPCTIPTWGKLRTEMSAVTIRRRRGPLRVPAGFAAGYGVCCFAAIFIVGFVFKGFANPSHPVIRNAFVSAGLGGLLGAILGGASGRGRAVLRLDQALRRLSLTSPTRSVELSFSQIDHWTVRSIPNPLAAAGQAATAPLLAVRTTDGADVPIHLFKGNATGAQIAQKAAQLFAGLTRRPFGPGGDDQQPRQAPPAEKPAEANEQLADFVESAAQAGELRRQYSDLM